MDFKYSYRFAEKAERDLENILGYIKNDLLNPTAATLLGKKIFDAIENVCEFPLSGMIVENEFLSDRNIRRIVTDNYITYYTINEKERTIYIIGIVYGKRNLEDIYRAI